VAKWSNILALGEFLLLMHLVCIYEDKLCVVVNWSFDDSTLVSVSL